MFKALAILVIIFCLKAFSIDSKNKKSESESYSINMQNRLEDVR